MTARFAFHQRPDGARASQTRQRIPDLLPDQINRIKLICADKKRRISDLISDAVDEYLRNHR